MEAITINTNAIGPLSNDQLFQLCQENPNLRIERKANGQLIFMTPTGGSTGDINSEINYWLRKWAKENNTGKVFDSSTGFLLPDGSMLSPDASWMKTENWKRLSTEEKKKFLPLCPAFIIELRSESDTIKALQEKMKTWIENGAQAGWLIDPVDEKAYIYKPQKDVAVYDSFKSKLHDKEILPGFELDLSQLKED